MTLAILDDRFLYPYTIIYPIALLAELGKLNGVMLAHLSAKNNDPDLALKTIQNRQERDLDIVVARQDQPFKLIEVEKK